MGCLEISMQTLVILKLVCVTIVYNSFVFLISVWSDIICVTLETYMHFFILLSYYSISLQCRRPHPWFCVHAPQSPAAISAPVTRPLSAPSTSPTARCIDRVHIDGSGTPIPHRDLPVGPGGRGTHHQVARQRRRRANYIFLAKIKCNICFCQFNI
jgi:hypothetical protein